MILKLAVEQARSQKRYTLWTGAFMTLALTFVACGLLLVATQRAVWHDIERVTLADRAHGSAGGYQFYDAADAEGTPYEGIPSVDEVDRILAEAFAGGSDVAAIREWAVVTRPPTLFPQLNLAAATGDYAWDLVLAEGSLPGDGEILLNAQVASELDLGVGDTIDLLYRIHPPSAEEPATESDWHTYTISGLSRACDFGSAFLSPANWCPDESYVSWEASSSPDGPLVCNECYVSESVGTAPLVPMSYAAWNIDHPALAGLRVQDYSSDESVYQYEPPGALRAASVGYAIAGFLAAGMLLAALAIGRSQAQARIQWVATARTLGATRRAVVGATLLESLLVAAAATVGSLTLAYGIASVAYPWMRGFSGPTIGPDFVPMPWWVAAAVALVGIVLSLIIAAVPAFWASRVSPVAAFKPVTDVTEVELSRRIPLWWTAPAFVVGVAAIWLGKREWGPVGFAVYFGAVLAGTAGFILLKEGLRVLVTAMGKRLARSRSGALQVTGDDWVSSQRNAVTLALLFALPAALLAWLMVFNNFSNLESHLAVGHPSSTWPLPDQESAGVWGTEGLLWALIVLVEFEFVALAITFSSRRSSVNDAATRQALGLSTLHQRQAAFVRHVVPQMGGAIIGATVGFTIGIATHLLNWIDGASTHVGTAGDYLPAWRYSTLSAGYGVLLVAAFASLGGLIVADAASRVRSPVEALKPIGKVRAR